MSARLIAVVLGLALAGLASASTSVEDAWKRAAAKLDMPVFATPSAPLGLTRFYVKPRKLTTCGSTKEQLTALYSAGGREVFFVEAKPHVCGDLGAAIVLGKPIVRGARSALFSLGPQTLLLIFTRQGVEIGIQTKRVTRAQLLAIANSVRLVPD